MASYALFLHQKPLDLTFRHQDPTSSPLDLSIRKGSISPASSTAEKEERSGQNVSPDDASITHSPSADMICRQQHLSTDNDDSSAYPESSTKTLSDDDGGIPCLPTPSRRGRKRKQEAVAPTPSSSSKRAKTTTNNKSIKPKYCRKCGATKKDHKLDNICPADFKKPNNCDARILEILERHYWRNRVFPRDNLVPPFYYRVRWSVEGERELIPHEKLLDYCTQETLNTFNRRFCRDCGLESGTNAETDHRFCPKKIRSTPPTKRTGSESYIKKLVERHYWPDCVDREGEESSFFKVEWSHPGQPDQPEYVPSSWIKKKQLNEYKSHLLFFFKNSHRL